MKELYMVDLKGQFEKIKNEVNNEFRKIFENSSFINGAIVKEFSNRLAKYLNVKHVIPCANGTDALQIALMALELKAGSEVITTPFTFIATAEVINLLNLKPVFVDVDENTFNIDVDKIEAKISNNTGAIIPVHLFGQCANMEQIMALAQKYNIPVIEDNAQAIGANYRFEDSKTIKSGCIGDIGCTSFFPSKNLGAYGDGGAIFTNNDRLADTMSVIGNHGMKIPYYHDRVGVNSRLDSFQAAVLNVKLSYLDDYISKRVEAAKYYNDRFLDVLEIQTPFESKFSDHVYHQYTLKIKNGLRDDLHQYLKSKNIPNAIYYPVPLHKQKAFENVNFSNLDLPISEKLCNEVLSLPMHTELDHEQLDFICDNVIAFFANS